jgi:predicted ATPase
MRAIFDQAGDNRFLPRYLVLLGEFAGCLGQAGHVALGIETIDGILARCERSEERWYVPELLRIKGELIALDGAVTATAEDHFLQAIQLAQRQDARSWELRSAISLARLRHRQDRVAEAHAQLLEVFACFSEGFETSDLQMAKQVLTELR